MREYRQPNEDGSFNVQTVLQLIRALGAILGVVAIVLGLVYASRMFAVVFAALRAPDEFQVFLDKWAAVMGGSELDIVVAGTTYRCARVFALVVLGGGAFLLSWISMGFIVAGAKALSWTLSDREATKRLLLQALGPAKKLEIHKPDGGDGA